MKTALGIKTRSSDAVVVCRRKIDIGLKQEDAEFFLLVFAAEES
jgi:hypothetical protein